MRGPTIAMLYALIAITLLWLTPQRSWAARAYSSGEMISNGDVRPAYGRTVYDIEESVEPQSTNALQLIVEGAVYDTKYRTKIPSLKQVGQSACPVNGRFHPRSLCRAWPTVKQSFEAAAKAMGIPAPALVCVMQAESNFVPGLTSGAGAAGLMQFMPDTARHFETMMRRSPDYQTRWKAYRRAGGTDRSVQEFTQYNIRSARPSTADVQIFATAMYFHDSMKRIAGPIKKSLGPPPEPNGTALRRLMHYWVVSYNGGGLRGIDFLRRLQMQGPEVAYRYLHPETQGYIRKFDNCVAQATRL